MRAREKRDHRHCLRVDGRGAGRWSDRGHSELPRSAGVLALPGGEWAVRMMSFSQMPSIAIMMTRPARACGAASVSLRVVSSCIARPVRQVGLIAGREQCRGDGRASSFSRTPASMKAWRAADDQPGVCRTASDGLRSSGWTGGAWLRAGHARRGSDGDHLADLGALGRRLEGEVVGARTHRPRPRPRSGAPPGELVRTVIRRSEINCTVQTV